MSNQLVTLTQVNETINAILSQVCAESGITVEQFWTGYAEAWNKAIEADEQDKFESDRAEIINAMQQPGYAREQLKKAEEVISKLELNHKRDYDDKFTVEKFSNQSVKG